MRTGTKIALGIIGGIFALIVIGIILLVSATKPPENINVQISAPLNIDKGEAFIIEVKIENSSSNTRKLESIDIYDEYFEGIAVKSTDPAYTQSYHVPISNSQSYEFNNEIPANSTFVVKFNAAAVKTGDFSSEADICIDSYLSCVTQPVRTIVE